MKLNELADCPGARKRAMRVGRGIASGKGKTAGRGHKGQKSRSGVALRGREGGQMPIYMRMPKRGFRNPFPRRFSVVDLARLDAAIEAGKLDGDKFITAEMLQAAGLIRSGPSPARAHWRLLGKGPVARPVRVRAHHVSAGARAAIEAAGGAIEIIASKRRARKLQQSEQEEA